MIRSIETLLELLHDKADAEDLAYCNDLSVKKTTGAIYHMTRRDAFYDVIDDIRNSKRGDKPKVHREFVDFETNSENFE